MQYILEKPENAPLFILNVQESLQLISNVQEKFCNTIKNVKSSNNRILFIEQLSDFVVIL